MGMTIDEVLKIIESGRIMPYIIKENNEDDTKFNTDNIEALNVIIDTIRKYQKIKEIVTKWQNETDPKIKFARSNMEKIKEVLEDEDE